MSIAVDPAGVVWCGSGPVNGKGIYRFDGSQWKSYTTANSGLPANEIYQMSTSCAGSVWGSSFGRGAVEIVSGHDSIGSSDVYGTNVGMVGIPTDPAYVVVSNVVCDSRGNTWMTILNAADKRVLVVRKPDRQWMTLPAILSGLKLSYLTDPVVEKSLAVDAFDNLWAVVRDGTSKGVLSLGNGGTIDSVARIHVTTTHGLPSDDIRTIVVDRDNDIWVGTAKGIAIILDSSNPTRTGGIASYKPLNGLVINTIAVDPLNQKWVGTTEGAVLLSADGTQILAAYTVQNTSGKLIGNDIRSIAVDGKSGTVFFGTASGLASLTTSAVTPAASAGPLLVYPNPYHVPNRLPLTVDGLTANSGMKILSIDGTLVRELTTPGGRLGFWDGKDSQGNDVASGIYVIVGYSEEGSEVAKGKVAVLRR
jgi:ligand-binding sensor domain-containing protein